MKLKTVYGALLGFAFVLLTAAGASRYINGTEIKQNVVLVNTTDAQTFTGATTFSSTTAHTGAATFASSVAVTGTSALSGAVTTASTLGVGTNLSVTGTSALSGAVSLASTLAVTGASALSGNVTVTGALAVTGATTMIGALTETVPPVISLAAAVSAAGTSKTDCTAITKEYNTITGTALQGVCLLSAVVGKRQLVYNDSAATLIVYPLDAGDDTLAVNDFAALTFDVGYAMGPLSTMDCTAYTTTAWHCVYTPGSRSTVAGAGTNQGNATQFASTTMGSFVAVTAADATVGVDLPTGGSATTYVPGCITVQSTVNTNTAYLKIYGANADDDTINGAGADAVYTMGAGSRVQFCSIDGVAWLTR